METDKNQDPLDSLESAETTVVSSGEPSPDSGGSVHGGPDDSNQDPKKKSSGGKIKKMFAGFNLYLLGFLLLIVIAIGVTVVMIQMSRRNSLTVSNFDTQSLDAESLAKLASTSTTVGDPKQTLSVESNAIFAGKVLIRDSLDVAGGIKVGGTLNLPGITVSGSSNFDQVNINSLSISGGATIQGQVNIQNNLSVSGSGSFGGPISAPQITINTLTINKDLQINKHIDAGGATPSRTNGGALGAGGTSSVSGTDTAGTVTISIGSGPGAGCFATINFTQAFNATPHIVVTPIGSAAAALNYYVNRSTTNFSICSTTAAAASSSFSFDYVAID